MFWLLQIGIVALLAVVVWQDFYWRAISVWLLLALIVLAVLEANAHADFSWLQGLMNIALVTIQLLAVKLYFSVKQGKNVVFTDHLMGAGDLVFFIIPCLLWGVLGFVFYYLTSLLLIAVGFLVWKKQHNKDSSVPLAGGMAATMIIGMFLSWVFPQWSRYDDYMWAEVMGIW